LFYQWQPGEDVANGAKRYRYNTAGFLVKVETYTDTWQPQAEMAYDGLGNRLAMTGYADGQSVTTQYTFDSGQTLLASAGELTTAYLYGLGAIGEQTDAWAYTLPDGTNTPRQMVDESGKITMTASYTPWGDTLEVHGTGNFTFGHFGGMMDTVTGLLYVGNGQYYDPATGRFLNRDTRSGQANPYVPWKADPAGAMIAPLALLALLYGGKKKRGKWDNLIIVLVLCAAVGMSLSACNPISPQPPSQSPTAPPVPSTDPTSPGADTQPSSTPRPAASPTVTLSISATITCTAMLPPNPTPTPAGTRITVEHINLSAYYTPLEKDFSGGGKVAIKANASQKKNGNYLLKEVFNVYTLEEQYAQTATKEFLYRPDTVCQQGEGKLENGKYISCTDLITWSDWNFPPPNVGFEWKYKDADEASISAKRMALETLAKCDLDFKTPFRHGDIVEIPELKKHMLQQNADEFLEVTDVGQGLCKREGHMDTLDVYIGEGNSAYKNNYTIIAGFDGSTAEKRGHWHHLSIS
jgi:RHS repeat-associated protein